MPKGNGDLVNSQVVDGGPAGPPSPAAPQRRRDDLPIVLWKMSKLRARILELRAQGAGFSEIARTVGRCRSTVIRYVCPKERAKSNTWRAQQKRRIKERLIEEAGGKCVLCGYDRCVAALDFHHLDPTEKDLRISRCSSYDEAKREAKKCRLLCANCHREVEVGFVKLVL